MAQPGTVEPPRPPTTPEPRVPNVPGGLPPANDKGSLSGNYGYPAASPPRKPLPPAPARSLPPKYDKPLPPMYGDVPTGGAPAPPAHADDRPTEAEPAVDCPEPPSQGHPPGPVPTKGAPELPPLPHHSRVDSWPIRRSSHANDVSAAPVPPALPSSAVEAPEPEPSSPARSRSDSLEFGAPEVIDVRQQASPVPLPLPPPRPALPVADRSDFLIHAPDDLAKPRAAFVAPAEDGRSGSPAMRPQVVSAAQSRQSSYGSIENGSRASKTYPQLQYHHQQFVEGNGVHAADGRDARATAHTSRSNSPASSVAGENMAPSRRHLTPTGHPYGRQSIVRPSSAYSTLSLPDGAKGRSSPGVAPGSPGNRRLSSNHSADSKRTSYVDLLNSQYPQPAPATGSFNNSHLRTAVGSNASLLSHKQTLEMYRMNAKKTNDPSIQYEFAVFMITAAQELAAAGPAGMDGGGDAGPRQGRDLDSPYVDNSTPAASQAELLREARQILQRLSDRSYPFAQYYLADGYASGLFGKGKEDYDKAFPLFVSAGKHGHAEASYRAALSYEFGWGCRKDPAKAVQFYRQSASKNHPGAMLRLGKACLLGDMGLGNRYREGLKWLKRGTESADQQYNAAPYELGLLHEKGFGDDVFQDETYAAQLFTQAADLGHAEASYRLGDAYEHGKLSCPRDPALSVHFYNGAAQHSHPAAMMALCAWYMVGAEPVLEKDENEAYEWARKAAMCGLAKAEYAVGYFTEMGIGCRRDPLEANVWYVRAADQGDERARQRLATIRAAASGDTSAPRSGKEKLKKPGQAVGFADEKQGKDDKDCVVM
ncbi:MAG: hypothetical protein M1832_004141 [Thelocarpon impressellum]|nr:MAG: hypothetical protein M1832_004141 [Thelocarpon impressellum]